MLYLVRHAQSLMNLAKLENAPAIEAGNASIVWEKSLIDAAITPLGHTQVAAARTLALSLPVTKVYVSPLFRALQTCNGLFTGHKNRPEIEVLPEATEIISDAGDVSKGNLAHKDQFAGYNWGRVEQIQSLYWMAQVSDNPELQSIVTTSKSVSEVIDKLCKGIAKAYPTHFESKRDAAKRVAYMRELLVTDMKQGRNVAVVGHRDVLRSLMRTFLPSGHEFLLENCQILTIPPPPS